MHFLLTISTLILQQYLQTDKLKLQTFLRNRNKIHSTAGLHTKPEFLFLFYNCTSKIISLKFKFYHVKFVI